MTLLYAIIADPIAQVRSPQLFNRRFSDWAIDARMVAMRVPRGRLPTVLAGLWPVENFAGAVVSLPHKFAAADVCGQLVGQAEVSGAVNVLRRREAGWEGKNCDGEGFVAGLRAEGHEVAGRSCAIVGCGGAGASIAAALLASDAAHVRLADLEEAQLLQVVGRLQAEYPGRVAAGAPDRTMDIAVNATPLGLNADDALPFDPACLDSRALVADIIMTPRRTRLLKAAAARGLATQEGRHMLDGQFEALWAFLRPEDEQ